MSCFNPRPRTGSDNQCRIHRTVKAIVSIHAPARGATSTRRLGPDDRRVSIHAPARGATLQIGWLILSDQSFNPRPRTGSDPPAWVWGILWLCFNPRPRTGSDDHVRRGRPGRLSFNPRPRTGSDQIGVHAESTAEQFQSTPPHGERLLQANSLCDNTKKTGWREPYPTLFVKNNYRHHRDSNLFKYQWVMQCADLPVFT